MSNWTTIQFSCVGVPQRELTISVLTILWWQNDLFIIWFNHHWVIGCSMCQWCRWCNVSTTSWAENWLILRHCKIYWHWQLSLGCITDLSYKLLHLHCKSRYHQSSHRRHTIFLHLNISLSFCCCFCSIQSGRLWSRKRTCSYSSANRRCSNYIWVIYNYFAY